MGLGGGCLLNSAVLVGRTINRSFFLCRSVRIYVRVAPSGASPFIFCVCLVRCGILFLLFLYEPNCLRVLGEGRSGGGREGTAG